MQVYPKDALEAIPLNSVSLSEGPWKRRFDLNRNYLLSLENDAYFEAFHWCFAPPGIRRPRPKVSWGGWMGTTHDGEFHGHYLSACGRTICLTGDEELSRKAASLVSSLSHYQQQNGAFWVGAMTEQDLVGLHTGKLKTIPYYTIHKMLMGLYELGSLGGSDLALEMSFCLADFVADTINKLNEEEITNLLACEYGGIAEIMLEIASSTQKQRHFDAAISLLDRSVIDPLSSAEDILTGRHANTTIPILQGAARAYEMTGEERYRRAVENFHEIVMSTRYSVTGGDCSIGEYWREPKTTFKSLCASTQETCATYNWQRLTEYLFRWTADPEYGDAYERGQINGILAAQHPETGMFVYFMPMKPGPREPNPDNYDPDPPETGSKHFGRPLRCFWCCYGTGIQAFSNPLSATYYRRGDTIWINRYIASQMETELNGVPLKIDVRTAFPYSGTVTFIIRLKRPTDFTLALRIPWWVGEGVSLRMNLSPFKIEGETSSIKRSSWLKIKRSWRICDTVEMILPMHLYTESMRDDPRYGAVLYGPHVLAGCISDAPKLDVPRENPALRLTQDTVDPFTFLYNGTRPLRFVPLSRIVDEEYNVYFEMV